jgi:hypothetical protein
LSHISWIRAFNGGDASDRQSYGTRSGKGRVYCVCQTGRTAGQACTQRRLRSGVRCRSHRRCVRLRLGDWARVSEMENAAGYVYRVGQSKARNRRRQAPLFPAEANPSMPWVEPGLPHALEALSEMQRQAETAELLGGSVSSVRKHLQRGEKKLQGSLGVGS